MGKTTVDPKIRMLLTTGEMGRLIGVHSKTVAGWVDRGELTGVRFPGRNGQERRVHRDEFRQLCIRMGYSWVLEQLDKEEGKTPEIKSCRKPKPKPKRPSSAGRRKPSTNGSNGKKLAI